MKIITIIITIFLIIFSFQNECLAKQGMLIRIVVSDFEILSQGSGAEETGKIVAEWLTTLLGQAGNLDMIDRATVEKAFQDETQVQRRRSPIDVALAVGNKLGADYLIMGTLISMTGGIEVTARLIDLIEGSTVKTENIKGRVGGDLTSLIKELAYKIRNSLPKEGQIVSLRERDLIINIGSLNGVEIGNEFIVLREPSITAPSIPGTVSQAEALKIALLKVASTDPKFSIASIVQERQDMRIKVGDRVRSMVTMKGEGIAQEKLKESGIPQELTPIGRGETTTPDTARISPPPQEITVIQPREAPKLAPRRIRVAIPDNDAHMIGGGDVQEYTSPRSVNDYVRYKAREYAKMFDEKGIFEILLQPDLERLTAGGDFSYNTLSKFNFAKAKELGQKVNADAVLLSQSTVSPDKTFFTFNMVFIQDGSILQVSRSENTHPRILSSDYRYLRELLNRATPIFTSLQRGKGMIVEETPRVTIGKRKIAVIDTSIITALDSYVSPMTIRGYSKEKAKYYASNLAQVGQIDVILQEDLSRIIPGDFSYEALTAHNFARAREIGTKAKIDFFLFSSMTGGGNEIFYTLTLLKVSDGSTTEAAGSADIFTRTINADREVVKKLIDRSRPLLLMR